MAAETAARLGKRVGQAARTREVKLGSLHQGTRQQRDARGWFNGTIGAIRALSNMPSRCPVAEESEAFGQQVHLLLHGRRNRTHKVYYSIHHETQPVRVFHIRHWSRKGLRADEIQELMDEVADQEEDA